MKFYNNVLKERVAAGEVRPVVLPYDLFGVLLLFIFLCIPHVNRPWLFAARFPVAALVVGFYLKAIHETTCMWAGSGFGVGLIAAWSAVWTMTWLVFNDPQHDAKRIERNTKKSGDSTSVEKQGNGYTTSRKSTNTVNGHVMNRQPAKGSVESSESGVVHHLTKDPLVSTYFWQSYPMQSLWARIGWVNDLISNFKGPGWSWEVSSNPGPPPEVRGGLGETPDSEEKPVSQTGSRRLSSRLEIARRSFVRLLCGYLLLDTLKVVLMKDTYFLLGPSSFPPPAYISFMPPLLVTFYRQLLSCVSIITALETIFALGSLTLCICLGPQVLGLRGEAWMYPTTWGSFSTILDKGLNGLWSGWWHQTFRFAFISPTQYLIRRGILKPKSQTTKIFSLVAAFAISSFLHGAGSYTQVPNTKFWACPAFFMLQALGIFLQTYFCAFFHHQISQLPRQIRRTGNLFFAFTWMIVTAPLLTDDFARGSIWLFEPVPFSPLRGLGFGEEGDRWSCWDLSQLGWFGGGKYWWQNGLAFF
jgi:hypothetical protein